MPNWIKFPSQSTHTVHLLCYERIAHPGTGYQFECDQQGVINEAKLTMASRTRLALCRDDKFGDFHNPYVITKEVPTHSPGVLACICGRSLSLDQRDVNACGCGRSYWENGEEVSDEAHGF